MIPFEEITDSSDDLYLVEQKIEYTELRDMFQMSKISYKSDSWRIDQLFFTVNC